ncbi:hypothetical protein D3C81_890180 [compost metagenome]
MHLRQDDQHANPGQHAVHHRGCRHSKPAAQLQSASHQLQQTRQQQYRPEHGDAVLADQLEYQNGQARRRAADLQWRTGQPADHQTTDDAGDQAFGRRQPRSNRDAHAQRQGDQKHNHRSQQLPWQNSFESSSTHGESPEVFFRHGKARLPERQPRLNHTTI